MVVVGSCRWLLLLLLLPVDRVGIWIDDAATVHTGVKDGAKLLRGPDDSELDAQLITTRSSSSWTAASHRRGLKTSDGSTT